jgi:iron complex transport system permease protein
MQVAASSSVAARATTQATGIGQRKSDAAARLARGSLSRRAVAIAASAVLGAVAVTLSLAIGSHFVAPSEVWHALTQHDSSYATTVVDSRIPRTILGAICGGSLAVAGVVMQAITRNPLGDPSLLGVNAGASAAMVTAGMLGTTATVVSPYIALPGAIIAAVIAYTLGGGGRAKTGSARLVLAGAVITALGVAYVQAVSFIRPDVFNSLRFWQVGSLAGRGPDVITAVLPVIVIGLVLAAVIVPSLNVLALGDEAALALGARVSVVKLAGLAATTLLCAGATAAAGPIMFVGLAVPHVVRSIVGSDHRWVMPISFFGGIALVLLCDVVGRVILAPNEVMAGVITSAIGAPVLLVAVRRMRGLG